MKIRTTTDLVSAIDSDLSWRKKELKYLATRLEGSESDPQICYLRAAIALLYAHWEGFVLAALRAYLNYVSNQRVQFEKLRPEIRAAVLKSELSVVENQPGNLARALLLRAYEAAHGKTQKIPDGVIKGDSNLNASRFLGLVAVVGLDEALFSSASQFLDESLLAPRNSVCHGERVVVDRDGYLSTERQVINLIEQLKNQILNAATLQEFKMS